MLHGVHHLPRRDLNMILVIGVPRQFCCLWPECRAEREISIEIFRIMGESLQGEVATAAASKLNLSRSALQERLAH